MVWYSNVLNTSIINNLELFPQEYSTVTQLNSRYKCLQWKPDYDTIFHLGELLISHYG